MDDFISPFSWAAQRWGRAHNWTMRDDRHLGWRRDKTRVFHASCRFTWGTTLSYSGSPARHSSQLLWGRLRATRWRKLSGQPNLRIKGDRVLHRLANWPGWQVTYTGRRRLAQLHWLLSSSPRWSRKLTKDLWGPPLGLLIYNSAEIPCIGEVCPEPLGDLGTAV